LFGYHGGLKVIPGYEAVMVFFVLSGFFISNSIFKSISQNRWSWYIYIVNRVTRLWIVLIPALFLTLFWAELRINFFHDIVRFYGVLDWKVFLGNLLFLQGISVPSFGLNNPLWSLSYEFWYYILFPCIVSIFYAPKKSIKMVYLTIVILLSLFLGITVMKYFLIWLLGAIIPLIKPISIKNTLLRGGAFIASSLFFLVAINLMYLIYNTNDGGIYFIDLTVGVSFSILVCVILSLYNTAEPSRQIYSYVEYLAGFSYTLYLTHYPLLLFIAEFLYRGLGISKGASLLTLVLKPIILIIIFLYAWAISRVTEAKTGIFRKFILKGIKPIKNYESCHIDTINFIKTLCRIRRIKRQKNEVIQCY